MTCTVPGMSTKTSKVSGDGLGLGEARKIATALDLDDLTEKQGTMNSLGLKWTLAVFSEF